MNLAGSLVRADDGAVVVERLLAADTFATRWLGLQFRSSLDVRSGLLLVPCGSIHTACMRFAVDAAFLDAGGKVVEVRRGVRPWRVAVPAAPAHAVLETAAGVLDALAPGVRLRLAAPTDAVMRPALRFLIDAVAGSRDIG